jgi:hypothetical protein
MSWRSSAPRETASSRPGDPPAVLAKPSEHTVEITIAAASYPSAPGALNFADGHAEKHRRLKPRTQSKPPPLSVAQHRRTPNNHDVSWLQERSTVPKRGPS